MFFLLPLYTNYLSSSEYGIADLIFTMSEIIRPFVSLAIYNGLLRYGLSESYKKEDVLRNATMVFIVGSIITLLITPLFGLYSAIRHWKWYVSANVIIVFASKNVLLYLKVSNKNKLYAVLSMLQALFLACTNILLLIALKQGLNGYLIANLVAPACVTVGGVIVGNLYRDLKRSTFNRTLMNDMIVYSMPFIVNDIAWWLIHSSDKVMIEAMLGSSKLGVYAAASKIPLLVNVLSSIFSQAWDLSVVGVYETDNNKDFYSLIYKYFLIFVFGITIIINSFIKPFMAIYVGAAFGEAWHYVPLLLISTTFSAIAGFLGSFYAASKNSKEIMRSTVLAGTINVILNYIFIPICGIWGAVFGTVVSYFIIVLYRLLSIGKYFEIDLYSSVFFMLIFIVVFQALCVSVDFYGELSSVIAITLFWLIVSKDLKMLVIYVIQHIRKKK